MVETRAGDESSAGSITDALEALLAWARRHRPDTDLSATAFTTLDRLTYAGPVRISELAQYERVSQPAMTGLINRLADEGLARRAADPSDGRAALVSITTTGRQAVAAYCASRAAALAAALATLPDVDLDALAAATPAIVRLTNPVPTHPDSPSQK